MLQSNRAKWADSMRGKGKRVDGGGFPLVETIVSLFMIVLCLGLGLRFSVGYFSSSHDTHAKTVAVQLASERVEKLKALPWTSLGFYGDDAAPSCTLSNCATQSTVVLGATRPSDAVAPRPSYSTTREALTFTVATFVTWPPSSSQSNG